MEYDFRRNWSKPLYAGLHLNQPSSESVYLKNDGIKIIFLKNFCQLPRAKLRCQLDPLILFSAGVGERRSAGLN